MSRIEPVEASLKVLKINYIVHTRIEKIEWKNNPDGYFVQFEGSRESLNFGIEPPQWSQGQAIKITFEGIE